MSASPNETDRLSFFRQSGWMMIATTASGVFMFAVHVFGSKMGSDYDVFVTMLQLLNMMLIPSIGLQTVFAQQTAAAVTEEKKRELAAVTRGVLLATIGIWAVLMLALLGLQHELVSLWKMKNAAALWVTVSCGLAMLWIPVVQGLLQGTLNFMWLGWVAIINGVGRFVFVGIIVGLMGGQAAGGMVGALIGMWVAVALGLWQTRDLLRVPRTTFKWKEWLGRVVPLTLGLGVGMFFLSFDQIIVQSFFGKGETQMYSPAGMLARGLVIFTSPLTAVMFPKIVQSAARSEKTNVLWLALGATALLAGGAALVCSLLPTLPLKLVYRDPAFLKVADLLPLFVWCMFPLTLTNVLVSNLLARKMFKVVPWLLLCAAGYAAALSVNHQSFKRVIVTLGLFNLITFLVAAAFTLKAPKLQNP